MTPEELVQRLAGIAKRHRRMGVRDRRLDLPAVADDAGVGEQPVDVGLAKRGHPFRIEACERLAKRRPLAQDRQPRESRLKPLEAEPLVDAALVTDRPPPLLVVVAEIPLLDRLPATDHLPVSRSRRPPRRHRPPPETASPA